MPRPASPRRAGGAEARDGDGGDGRPRRVVRRARRHDRGAASQHRHDARRLRRRAARPPGGAGDDRAPPRRDGTLQDAGPWGAAERRFRTVLRGTIVIYGVFVGRYVI